MNLCLYSLKILKYLSIYSFNTQPDNIKLQVFQDKTLLSETDLENTSFLPVEKDGKLRYELTATWNQKNEINYHGSAKYVYTIVSDFPATLEFDKLSGQIGDYFKLLVNHLNTNETIHLEQSLLGSFQFTQVNGVNVGYLPVSYHTKAGTYPITFWTETDDGIKTEPLSYDLVVDNRDFKIQYLTISTTTEKATRNDQAYSQFAEYFTPTRERPHRFNIGLNLLLNLLKDGRLPPMVKTSCQQGTYFLSSFWYGHSCSTRNTYKSNQYR